MVFTQNWGLNVITANFILSNGIKKMILIFILSKFIFNLWSFRNLHVLLHHIDSRLQSFIHNTATPSSQPWQGTQVAQAGRQAGRPSCFVAQSGYCSHHRLTQPVQLKRECVTVFMLWLLLWMTNSHEWIMSDLGGGGYKCITVRQII